MNLEQKKFVAVIGLVLYAIAILVYSSFGVGLFQAFIDITVYLIVVALFMGFIIGFFYCVFWVCDTYGELGKKKGVQR